MLITAVGELSRSSRMDALRARLLDHSHLANRDYIKRLYSMSPLHCDVQTVISRGPGEVHTLNSRADARRLIVIEISLSSPARPIWEGEYCKSSKG